MSAPELERAIVEDLDDLDAYLVYADWLLARGDPRGELIAVQVALARSSDDATLKQREAALLAQHSTEWLANFAGLRWVNVTWRYGFIDELAIWRDTDQLREMLALPAARLVRGVRCVIDYANDAVTVLAEANPPALRTLEFGHWSPRHEPGEYEADLGDLSGLWTHRRLEKVVLTGAVLSFGTIDAPELRHFEWSSFGPESTRDDKSAANLSSLTSARWPKLETLDLWFARGDGYNSARLPWMRKLMNGEGLGNLKHLALRQFALWPDELRSELERSTLLPQLETLDLSAPYAVDDATRGALRALRDRPAFQHLARFEV